MNIEKLVQTVPLIDMKENDNFVRGLFEKYNITWSIKIKMIYQILKEAIEKKELDPSKILLEASSGNTAIALAYLSNLRWIKVEIVLPESTALPKKNLIKAYWAKIIEVQWVTDNAIVKRDEMVLENPNKYFVPNQFGNYANMRAHYNLTWPYILEKLWRIDYFVAWLGTSGTIIGTAKYLKEKLPNIKIIAWNPIDKIEWLRNFKTTKVVIPFFEEYKYLIDEIIDIDYKTAIREWVKPLMGKWYFVWPSSWANYALTKKVASWIKWKKIVFLAPDGGDVYLENYVPNFEMNL